MLHEEPTKKREQISLVCIDELVPQNHLLRKIDRVIDWSFIYDLVKEKYSPDFGRPSIDPVILIKIVLIQYLYGIRSMRQTIREIEVNLAYRWFLGLGMYEKVPHFSTFGKNYTRRFKGTDLFEQIFSKILQTCINAGLVDPSEVFIDATHVKACANSNKLQQKVVQEEALFYYQTPKAFSGVDPFDYLHDTANLEELDRSTEKLLGIRGDDKASEKVWYVVYPFVTFCKPILEGVEPVTDLDAAVRDATESSYVMGMLLAMRHHDKEEEEENRSTLNKSLEKLAESTKDYDYTPPVSNARCYSIAIPDEVPLYFRCDRCGKSTSIQVYAGQEKQIIDKYRSVANEFTQLGYPATVKCYCDQCADQNYPSYNMYRKNNFIFSVSRPDCEKPVNSFPATHSFNDFQYKVALAFLKGANTLPKLSAATDTKLSAQAYLDHVHNVLGNVVTGTGGTSK